MLKLLIVLLNSYVVICNSFKVTLDGEVCKNACHELADGKINVHLVPHSHDDVGWLKTYDEYYKGTGNFDTYENAGVQYILDSTIQELKKNANRRFIQVETAFFWKWWNDQNATTRNLVKDLVNNGQLEMVNGGWSMNDEAATHYHSIIDQFTWGFRVLEDTVGECGRPKIGWQIDPFGHSREHASIVKQLGFDGLVIGRLDYRDKAKRRQDKNLDFIWNTNNNFAEGDAEIFTTMFPGFYSYEQGFCFDVFCKDPDITDDDLQEKVTSFTKSLDKYKDYYQTHNIMLPMGNDFSYQKAEKNFENIDKLIEGFKDHETYNVIYSTPSCYIQAVKNEVQTQKIKLTTKTDDFFPYASGDHSFWTGYFSSRPTLKRFERVGNNILQSVKQLTTFSRTKGNDDDKNILDLRMAMGVMQHHDAITGTEKQAVADDYSSMLDKAIKETEASVNTIIGDLLKKEESAVVDLKLQNCLRANMSICDISKKDRFVVTVHNPLSKAVSHYVHLPVDGENYKITGPPGEIVLDIFDAIHAFDFVTDGGPATKELVFLAKDVPPLGIKLYYVEKVDGAADFYHKFEDVTDQRSFGDETNNAFSIGDDGKLEKVTINGQVQNIKQDFLYYNAFSYNQVFNSGKDALLSQSQSSQASGAYVFRPQGSAIVLTDTLVTLKFAKGNLVDEIYQVFDDEITQIIRVYKGEEDFYIEFDWLVGNLKLDTAGREIITRFTVSDFENNEIFYTDANGRQQIQRKRNRRSDYNYDYSEEPVSSNYYPVTSRIVIKDETQQLQVAVLNDRAQGGSSLKEGEIELMVHRRDLNDDGFGVSEALNEMQYGKGLYARGQHYLTFAKVEEGEPSPAVFERDLAHRKLLAPLVLVGDATGEELSTVEKVQALVNFKFEALTKTLSDNIQILTLEPWKDSYIVRLEHIFEKGEDAALSQSATVDLTDLFTLFNVTQLTPVSLGANQNLESASSGVPHSFIKPAAFSPPSFEVTLKPMEIKTFIFLTNKRNKGGTDTGIVAIQDTSSSNQILSSMSILTALMLVFTYCFNVYLM